ncbi:hypothetical protein O181_100344 [Austropuccinia psidii MF-1]|uniref:Uncharacterized protein n=1 Tax=Austropuccinia psidii MF-1 TaxID=1389203 RepID=A0A9Q3PGB6_9BASI|nr:hypothetical protein [Austropuccinia psidii MF-1]
MNSYLHIKSFLGQEKTIEPLGGWSPLSCKYKVKKIKNLFKNKSLLSIDQKNELEMTTAFEKEGQVASTSSKPAPEVSKDKPKGPQKRQSPLAQTLPTGVKDSQIGACSCGQCLQFGKMPHGIHSKRAGKDEQDLFMHTIQEIKILTSIIDVEIGKFDAKLNKITSDISELKRNDKTSTEWYKLTNVKLDSITNTCDRMESKCQAQEDEIGYISISHIIEQLSILRSQVLEIINSTNQFVTHLEKCGSESHKLENEIIANGEQIHNNYEPDMPRNSTPFTEEKPSVKGSLTPFLGENPICAKYIPKLE